MSRRPIRSALVASGALVTAGVVGLMSASPALTATDDAATSVRRSVQTLMDPSGAVKASRVYTQVQSSGQGDVSFVEQLSGSLRNLNGFGSPASSADGKATWNYSVSGLSNQRTLQVFPESSLPITVKATATLDGTPIEIADIVGKSGLLKMSYVIENTTAQEQEISWTDGAGVKQTKTVSIPLPYVGSMDTVLPDSYSQVNAPGASVGGTGRGTTQLSYTLLLYPPLGQTTATVSYEARVADAEVPEVDFTFLPTPPSGNPTTKSALEQYQGGQATGAKLTDGATQIDTNLLKLADGAGQLNDGLAQLLAGANQLSTGLEPAAAGATQLADGLAPAADGASQLADGLTGAVSGSKQLAAGAGDASDGADKLEAGSARVAGGATQVASGSKDLYEGLVALSAGLGKLYAGVDALPASVNATLAADPSYQKLLGTLSAIIAGIGTPTDATPSTLQGGLNLVKGGLNQVVGGLRNPNWAGTTCNPAASPGATDSCGVADVNQYVAAVLNAAATSGGSLDVLAANINGAASAFCAGDATCLGTFATLATCINGSTVCNGSQATIKAQSLAGAGGLTLAYQGVDTQIIPAINTQLVPGVNAIKKALYNSPCSPVQTNPAASDYCGISQALALVKAGIPQLVDGITANISATLKASIGQPTAGCNPTATLACASAALTAGAKQLSGGATQVAGGATQVADGNAELATGLARLSDGSAQLAAGLPAAQDGAQQLADGLPAAADGAQQLADGLPAAADGASQIADGLTKAVPGGTQIEDGANQLSTEGTKALIVAGQDTTNSFGEKAATMEAIDARAADGSGIPNGNATPGNGSDVITTGAFGFFMDGVSKSEGQNALRFILAGLLLAGAVGAGVVLGRR